MRNIFDQYQQPENRLTHALLSCLDADRRLLRDFLRWLVPDAMPSGRLAVLEQGLPGESPALSEEDVGDRGLPDGWIHNDEGWALLIESKVAARPSADQVRRHFGIARHRGATDVRLLWVTVTPVPHIRRRDVINRTWEELYEWLTNPRRRSAWSTRAAEYFEIAEVQADMKEHLKEGTLTHFAGIPFDDEHPYTYTQAKRILGLLRERLLLRQRLTGKLAVDREHAGRGHIKGRAATYVWDFLALRGLGRGSLFTSHPHLTLGITNTQLEAFITFPNSIRRSLRQGLLGDEYGWFATLVQQSTERLVECLRSTPGALPRIVIVQRHYLSQSAPPNMDSTMQFDPRTAFQTGGKRGRGKVRYQPEWLKATYEALRRRRSNLQFQIGAVFPYNKCPAVQHASIDEAVAKAWIACRPVLQAAMKMHSTRRISQR